MKITSIYNKTLPNSYLNFLKENPDGSEVVFNHNKEDDPDDDGKYWQIIGEAELLKSFEMNDVGTAQHFESLKLYVKVFREFAYSDKTDSNVGDIPLDRVEHGFVIGEENGDYVYLDSFDNFSVWIYHHDGGDVTRIADSFEEFLKG